MPALVTDLLDMMRQHQSDRAAWEQTWLETARYALPDAERFDRLFMSSRAFSAIDSVISEPVAARRSKEIYDQTSLWAVERGTNGTLSLITPQTGTWHDCGTTDPFAGDPTDEEDLFYETLRDYLFATRANPRSGFWQAHKASTRCMWAFGTGVVYVEESKRGSLEWVRQFFPRAKKSAMSDAASETQSKETVPAWLHELAHAHHSSQESEEYLDTLKTDFFSHRVFVFTPQGDVIDLPIAATPIDFAYAVHSDLGNRMSGARVNGKMVSLDTALRNGDMVEIITKPSARPSRKWHDIAKTSMAKKHIRNTLAAMEAKRTGKS